MRNLIPLFAFAFIAAVGCGTGVYNHHIDVTLNDPAKRLGAGPVEVSIFDKTMGYSEDWARKTLGRAAPNAPYVGDVSSTAVKMFYDRTPPTRVDAGLFLPLFEKRGYFVLDVAPVDGVEQTTTLRYASFLVPTAAEDAIPPLTARFRSVAARKGWTIHLTVDVPK